MVVFVTAYPEYTVESYKVNALDYLLKSFIQIHRSYIANMKHAISVERTHITIDECKDLLSFSSQSAFGKYFCRLTGMSPKEYRRIRQ